MSKPTNKKLIGLFVLGATALLVVALVIFGSGKIFTKTVPVVFYFEGSVRGLDVGSPVVFRGVKVGSVTHVEIQYDLKDLSIRIPVFAETDPDKIVRFGGTAPAPGERAGELKRMIDHGLRGQLQFQSIVTGQLMINLDFLPNTPVRLVGKDPSMFEIPTIPTPMEALAQRLEKIPLEQTFEKLASSLQGVERMVNSPEVQGGIKSLAQSVEEMRKLIKDIKDEIKPLAASVQGTLSDTRSFVNHADAALNDAQKLIQNVDRRVGPLADRLESTLDGAQALVGGVNGEVGPLAVEVKKTLEETRAALVQVQKSLQAAEGHYGEGSSLYYGLSETLEGLNEASRSIQLLTEYLKRYPDSILWGKGKPGGT